MTKAIEKSKDNSSGIITLPVNIELDFDQSEETPSIDLSFKNVDHSHYSYEVWVFANNPQATIKTPRKIEQGYLGRFTIFGHGGCFGQEGHCNYSIADVDKFNPNRPHPVAPVKRCVTLNSANIEYLQSSQNAITSLTLVPISQGMRKAFEPEPDAFTFTHLEVKIY